MNATTTFKNPAPQHAGVGSKINAALAAFAKMAFGPVDAHAKRAESVRDLLALADSYAETQPSFAADLRAAAMSQIRAD